MSQKAVKEYLVGSEDHIPEQGSVWVQAGDLEVGVFKVHGRLYAWESRCPHQGGPVCEGTVLGRVEEILAPDKTKICERLSDKEIHVVCPWHGYEYNVESGRCFADPRLKLKAVALEVRNGQVYIVA